MMNLDSMLFFQYSTRQKGRPFYYGGLILMQQFCVLQTGGKGMVEAFV
jgi:hypothetical protein